MRFAPDLARRIREFVGKEDLEAYFGYDIRFVLYMSDQGTPDFSEYLGEVPKNASVSPWGVASVQGNFLHFSRRINPMSDLAIGDLDSYPWPRYEPNTHKMRVQVKEIQASGYAAISNYECGSYEQACALRGQEQFLIDLAADPEFAEALLSHIAEIKVRKAMANAEAGVDVVWIGDDLGVQNSLAFDLDIWQQMIRPPLQRIVDAVRSIRKDVIIAYHSCGYVEPVAGELADLGIDVLESVQPEANDVSKLKALHGDRLAFWGTMGAQSTFPFGSAQDVRIEVSERIGVMGKCGGLMLAPAHVLEPEVPVENVLAFVDEIKRTAS
jgi:uroporphyrinogen decarboxylase